MPPACLLGWPSCPLQIKSGAWGSESYCGDVSDVARFGVTLLQPLHANVTHICGDAVQDPARNRASSVEGVYESGSWARIVRGGVEEGKGSRGWRCGAEWFWHFWACMYEGMVGKGMRKIEKCGGGLALTRD